MHEVKIVLFLLVSFCCIDSRISLRPKDAAVGSYANAARAWLDDVGSYVLLTSRQVDLDWKG